MANKILKTRVQNKCDTAANWKLATNFKPLKGEIILYTDTKQMKVGDGNTLVDNLPFYLSSGGSSAIIISKTIANYPTASNPNASISFTTEENNQISNKDTFDDVIIQVKISDKKYVCLYPVKYDDIIYYFASSDNTYKLNITGGAGQLNYSQPAEIAGSNTFTGSNTFNKELKVKTNSSSYPPTYTTVGPTNIKVQGTGYVNSASGSSTLTSRDLTFSDSAYYETQYSAASIQYTNRQPAGINRKTRNLQFPAIAGDAATSSTQTIATEQWTTAQLQGLFSYANNTLTINI